MSKQLTLKQRVRGVLESIRKNLRTVGLLTEWDTQTAQELLKEQQRRIGQLERVLRLVEWSRSQHGGMRECPSCHNFVYMNDPLVHKKSCLLAQALGRK